MTHPPPEENLGEKMVISKNPVETVGINKTLPSRGSNCCFEKNPYLKVRIRNPLVQLHPLSKCKRRRWHHVQGVQRCPEARAFFRSRLLPWGPGYQRADSWRRSLLESLVHDSGKTSGDRGAVPCGTYKAKLTGD